VGSVTALRFISAICVYTPFVFRAAVKNSAN
jgi:hypothetical protein